MNTHKMKRQRNSDTKKTGNKEPQQIYFRFEQSVINYWGLKLVLRAQLRQWYKHLVGCSVRIITI